MICTVEKRNKMTLMIKWNNFSHNTSKLYKTSYVYAVLFALAKTKIGYRKGSTWVCILHSLWKILKKLQKIIQWGILITVRDGKRFYYQYNKRANWKDVLVCMYGFSSPCAYFTNEFVYGISISEFFSFTAGQRWQLKIRVSA